MRIVRKSLGTLVTDDGKRCHFFRVAERRWAPEDAAARGPAHYPSAPAAPPPRAPRWRNAAVSARPSVCRAALRPTGHHSRAHKYLVQIIWRFIFWTSDSVSSSVKRWITKLYTCSCAFPYLRITLTLLPDASISFLNKFSLTALQNFLFSAV